MEDQTTVSSVSAEKLATAGPSSQNTDTEHRQAYGTAKTENLRDSGLWRTLLPAAIVVFCLALLAIPLIILISLLVSSLTALSIGNQSEGQLIWLWLTMIVLAVIIAGIVIRGFYTTFLTQAGNYNG